MSNSKRVDYNMVLKTDRIYPEDDKNKQTNFRYIGEDKGSSKDHEPWSKNILDPNSKIRLKWNQVFLISCLIAICIDPMFYYLPSVVNNDTMQCVQFNRRLNIYLTLFRSLSDLFYILNIAIKFRTAYIAPSSRIFGRGELVMDPEKIAWRYLKSGFFIDLFVALPIPQIVIWVGIPAFKNIASGYSNTILGTVVMVQYFPRLHLLFPLSYEVLASVVTETAWIGAVCNLLLYMIASHVLGAGWYLLTAVRQIACWKMECGNEGDIGCTSKFLDCSYSDIAYQQVWANKTQIFANCDANNKNITFSYGIHAYGLQFGITSTDMLKKYFFALWWGLQQLSSFCQNLTASLYIGETTFCILLCILGIVLLSHLIGNVQGYLQSLTRRVEEWRLKQGDTEEWMEHRQLPHDLKERVRRYNKYKWFATGGVDEEEILESLPTDLHRDIKRHLCLDLVCRVPFFSQMDDQLLDAICARLVSSLSIKGTYVLQEGYPVSEMLFIIRGRLISYKGPNTETGFHSSIILLPGAFCGEELLTWALQSKSDDNLPMATRTVRAVVDVEAFALGADDLMFIAGQFRRLHSKKFKHTFRFYSHEWRTWAASYIQIAWRRYRKKRLEKELSTNESLALGSNRF